MTTEGDPLQRIDVVVVGAGLLGLATANELASRHPGLAIAVVDKESGPAVHQSGHNSGVLHAGVYYTPGSLKAELCVEGKALMEQFADDHGIAYEKCGKLIVALSEAELPGLAELLARGTANGVQGLRTVGPEEMREIEPHVTGIRAVHSPATGIIDFVAVARALTRVLIERGVDVRFNTEVTGVRTESDGSVVVETNAGAIHAKRLISCAGLQSDRVARMDSDPDVSIMPFRGDYYTLTADARELCRGLIYPVPDPSLPFLGVHFTKRYDGEVWAGPNAVLATRREGYRRTDFRWRDVMETLRAPGFGRLARSYWRTGAAEIWRDVVKAAFVRDLQRYVPDIRSDQLVFGPSGVRAQAVGADGRLVDDFRIATSRNSLHVLNAPSPAATASLAIARRLADQAQTSFDDVIPAGSGREHNRGSTTT